MHEDIPDSNLFQDPAPSYRLLAETIPAGVVLMDRTGKILYANEMATKITGYSVDEYNAAGPITHPDDTVTPEVFERALEEGTTGTDHRAILVRKDGTPVWVSLAWRPTLDKDGQIEGMQTVFMDITERRLAEEERRKAHADLERAYELQREFLNNVTHEVRTPLTAVKGYVMMLLEGMAGEVTEEQAELLRRVLVSSDHLLDVVSGVLEMARLRSGTVALHPRVCKPSETVKRAVSAVLPQAGHKGLGLNVSIPDEEQTAIYDEEKLTVVLTNLMSNAVKFTMSGRVDVMLSCDVGGCEFIVADSGPGISDDKLSSIFDEFRQLDYPHKHKPAGFGLGLAIVASMVEALGAGLTVSSRTGVGTAFTVRVPVLEAQ